MAMLSITFLITVAVLATIQQGIALKLPALPGVLNSRSGLQATRLQLSSKTVTDNFNVIQRGETQVLEVPTTQDGLKLYIAVHGSFQTERPGNGGMRMLPYDSEEHAIADAVRLAEGMTKKHAMYQTGFSGAKLVVNYKGMQAKDIDRSSLMRDTAIALEKLEGSVYTGCDIGSTDNDMSKLVEQTDFVLAGIGSSVDTNVATATSVIGALQGIAEAHDNKISDSTYLVQGCGKVGRHVATELITLGAKEVITCDLYPELANLPGCRALTAEENWFDQKVDVLVPCANSLAINEEVIAKMAKPKYVCGATNQPFSSASTRDAWDQAGVLHVPESISSAGAILADSIEWCHPQLFKSVVPEQAYGWIREISLEKSRSLCNKAGLKATRISEVISSVYEDKDAGAAAQIFPQWIEENSKETDFVVIGGGMAGTATAYANSKAGLKTCLIEAQNSIAPDIASSNGDSRMYRQMYSDPFFSKMQTMALKQWSDIETELGNDTKLLHKNGLLFYGEDTPETVEGSVAGAQRTMADLNLPHTHFTNSDDIESSFPSLQTKGRPYQGVFEETAGHVRASAACKAMTKLAEDSPPGCDVMLNAVVSAIEVDKNSGKIQVVTNDGTTVQAKHCVVAAGPWTNELLQKSFGIELDLEIWRIHWAHYELTDDAATMPQAFFFKKESDCGNDGGLYYVFPETATEKNFGDNDDNQKRYVKVGVDFKTTKSIDVPTSMDQFSFEPDAEVLQMIDTFVAQNLKGVGKRISSHVSPYTMSKDSYFVIDRIPTYDNISIFAGGSGRAFKFAPLIGDLLSKLARGVEKVDLDVDLDRFAIDRQEVNLKSTV